MKTFLNQQTKNLMLPARPVFEGFAKTGGEVPKAPEEVSTTPAAASEQDAQKAREAAEKRAADLRQKIQKVEADPTIKGEAKKNIIEQAKREMEATRREPVLSDEQHAANVDAINRIPMPAPGDPNIPPAGLPDAPAASNETQRNADTE